MAKSMPCRVEPLQVSAFSSAPLGPTGLARAGGAAAARSVPAWPVFSAGRRARRCARTTLWAVHEIMTGTGACLTAPEAPSTSTTPFRSAAGAVAAHLALLSAAGLAVVAAMAMWSNERTSHRPRVDCTEWNLDWIEPGGRPFQGGRQLLGEGGGKTPTDSDTDTGQHHLVSDGGKSGPRRFCARFSAPSACPLPPPVCCPP